MFTFHPILAVEHPATASAHLLIPVAPGWITGFLLLILWLTVAAILLGPLLRHFHLEPHSPQSFTGDKPLTNRRQ